jgi:hypothetical protein
MPIKRLGISNLEIWGNLVKSWATGVNKVEKKNSPGYKIDKYTKPRNKKEFEDQCALAGVGVVIPSYVEEVDVVQATMKTLLIRIPPKELVEDSEQTLSAPGATYAIPDFYNELYPKLPGETVPPKPTNLPQDEDGKLRLHALRIGDYTMANCL